MSMSVRMHRRRCSCIRKKSIERVGVGVISCVIRK